jgi:hypothetical protein
MEVGGRSPDAAVPPGATPTRPAFGQPVIRLIAEQVPALQASSRVKKDVDARHKAGHDERERS